MTETLHPGSGQEQVPNLPEHEVVVCAVGREHFALPLESLAEIFKISEITPLPLSPPYLVGVVTFTVIWPRCCPLEGCAVWWTARMRAFCLF